MTRDEAVEKLEAFAPMVVDDTREAIDMAIEALQDDWIPVSERLPEKNGYYIVSLEDAVDPCASFYNGKWYYVAFDCVSKEYREHEVIAWMPLPAPYKGGEEND